MSEPAEPARLAALRAVLALDLGGTQVRAAVVEDTGALRNAVRTRTPVADGGTAIVAACIRMLEAARDAYASSPGAAPIVAVGVSAPGPLDPRAGVIVDPPNLGASFQGTPIIARLEAALGLPGLLDRDTQVAALAEGTFGAAVGCRDYLYITVSTGIGGAIVSDGRLIRGPDGTAGELGHLLIDRYGPPCGCGAPGHLEGIASGSGIARAARLVAEEGASAPLASLVANRGNAFGARDVAKCAAAGDAVAESIMAGAREAFALACITLVDVFNPDLIVVGGSVAMGQGEAWFAPARDAVRRLGFRRPAARARIVPAALGDDVGLIGGLVLVRERRPGLLMGPVPARREHGE